MPKCYLSVDTVYTKLTVIHSKFGVGILSSPNRLIKYDYPQVGMCLAHDLVGLLTTVKDFFIYVTI